MMNALPVSLADFSVYHYDSRTAMDVGYQGFDEHDWYRDRVVHRGFVTGSGCTVEALKETIKWMLHGGGSGRYTHLWKIDSDLGFGLFSLPGLRGTGCSSCALSLPASDRTVDAWQARYRSSFVRAQLAPFPTPHVLGRERLLLPVTPPKDDVEIMCPLIDARILPAVAVAIEPMDTRNDVVAGEAINTIAQAFARVARARAIAEGSTRPQRPGGLVFDYVPLIHRDSRLLGWGSRTRASKNETRCPRGRIDGRFGRGNHPRHGKWRSVFANATSVGTDFGRWVKAMA